MQGPMNLPPGAAVHLGRGAEHVGKQVLRYGPDALSLLNVGAGALRAYKGYRYLRDAYRARRAAQGAMLLGADRKAKALALQEARRAAPREVTAKQVRAAAESANKQFRRAKALTREANTRAAVGRRKVAHGHRQMSPLGASRKGLGGAEAIESDHVAASEHRTMIVKLPNGRYANIPSSSPRTGREYAGPRQALDGAYAEGYTVKSYATRAMAILQGSKASQRSGEDSLKRGY